MIILTSIFCRKKKNDVESDQENKEEEEEIENNVKEKSKKVESNRTILPPSSTGRVRFLPKKFTS